MTDLPRDDLDERLEQLPGLPPGYHPWPAAALVVGFAVVQFLVGQPRAHAERSLVCIRPSHSAGSPGYHISSEDAFEPLGKLAAEVAAVAVHPFADPGDRRLRISHIPELAAVQQNGGHFSVGGAVDINEEIGVLVARQPDLLHRVCGQPLGEEFREGAWVPGVRINRVEGSRSDREVVGMGGADRELQRSQRLMGEHQIPASACESRGSGPAKDRECR